MVILKVYENSVDWQNQKMQIWFYRVFKPGMTEKDASGNPMAEVVGVHKYDDRPDNPVTYLTVKLKTVFNNGQQVYTYKGKNVLVGSAIPFIFDNVNVEGMVVSMDAERRLHKKRLAVKAQLFDPEDKGTMPFVADAITEGSTVKDSWGDVVLTVKKATMVPAQKLVTTSGGDILLSTDPLRKDIYMDLEIAVTDVNGKYYFYDSIPVTINKDLPVHLKNISIMPTITDIRVIP
jgi:hypothetical protein